MNATKITLPYTRPPLSANDGGMTRGAKMARSNVIRKTRQQMVDLATIARLPKNVAHLTVTLHYRPRDRRTRDSLNLYPTVKALVDGLTPPKVVKTKRGLTAYPGYGMIRDDAWQLVSTPEPQLHEPIKGQPGSLWLELEWT